MKAQQFLDAMASTANALDLDAHMDLISKQVRVFGVPGYEIIGHQDWYNQCEYEFSNRVLKRVSYQGLNIVVETLREIMFMSIETVEGSDGAKNVSGIEFIIQKEDDGIWRVSQERVLPEDELENEKRLKKL
jgi:hypothetical protein